MRNLQIRHKLHYTSLKQTLPPSEIKLLKINKSQITSAPITPGANQELEQLNTKTPNNKTSNTKQQRLKKPLFLFLKQNISHHRMANRQTPTNYPHTT